MQTQDIPAYPEGEAANSGIYVSDGYGIAVKVRRRHLVVTDGIGDHRREQRFHKATSGLRRLVVLGHTGYITFEALRWMTDANVGYLQLDRDGTILATTGALGVGKAELRRAQVRAATNQQGIELTRWILQRKLTGQADVASRFSQSASEEIRELAEDLDTADDLDELRIIESHGARTYWAQWAEIPVEFVTKDQARVSDHWKAFGTRGSTFGSGGRLAVNPSNALLNYLYALLEAETTLACSAAGLDPGIGVLHVDSRTRASLALDLMEAIRPEVDRYLLDLIDGHVFRAADFRESKTGVCRIIQPLTHQLAGTLRLWFELVAPIVEQTIRIITDGADRDTHLTQNNRRPDTLGSATPTSPPLIRIHCLECGAPTSPSRRLCDPCRDAKRGIARLSRLAEMRTNGDDPAHGGQAAQRRGQANRRHQLAVSRWNEQHPSPSRRLYDDEILPSLAKIRLELIAEATGLSLGYCSFIRRGLRVPHPRHWESLLALVEAVARED